MKVKLAMHSTLQVHSQCCDINFRLSVQSVTYVFLGFECRPFHYNLMPKIIINQLCTCFSGYGQPPGAVPGFTVPAVGQCQEAYGGGQVRSIMLKNAKSFYVL